MYDVDFLYEDSEIGSDLQDSPIAKLLMGEIDHLYPAFEKWLARGIRQTGRGEKAAIGAWSRKAGLPSELLKGICILKRGSDTWLEIKTLYLCEELRGREVPIATGGRAKLGQRLLDTVLTLAREQDYTRVTIDIPTDDMRLLRFLLRNGFVFERRHEEFKRPFYFLARDVQRRYCDDPGDIRLFLQWLLDASGISRTEDATMETNEEAIQARATGKLPIFKVPALEIDLSVELRWATQDPQACRVAVFYEREHQPLLCSDWHRDEMLRQAGIAVADWPGFAPKLPAIIVAIRKAFLDRYDQIEGDKKVFFKTGHFGRPLLGWPEPGAVVFFQDAEEPDMLLGLGHVQDVKIGSPAELWEQFQEMSVFDQKDYRRYSHVKKKMTAVVFSDFEKRSFKFPVEGRTQPWRYVVSERTAHELHEFFGK